MTTAHFEPLSGVVRLFTGGATYGDKYDWCCSVRFIDDKTIELLGVMKAPTIGQTKALKRFFLEEHGIETITWSRKAERATTIRTASTSRKGADK